MSQNLRILVDNVHDDAETLSATSEALPLAYTQRSGRAYVWRSTTTDQQVLEASFTGSRFVSMVVLYAHNLSTEGEARLELLQAGQVVYDSGSLVLSGVIPLGQWRAGIDPWGSSDISELPIQQFAYWLDMPIGCDAYRITLTDPNNPAGYLEVGRIFAGRHFSPSYNASYGLELTWQEFSENRRTEAGSLRTVGSGIARRLSFSLDYLDDADRRTLTRELLRVGRRNDLYVSVYPERGGLTEFEHAFAARREDDYRHTHDFHNNWAAPITLQEV